jgi:hypothetical protein
MSDHEATGGDVEARPEDASAEDPAALEAENARLRAELARARAAEGSRSKRHRLRGVLTGILVVLTSLLVTIATIGVWTQRTLADTDRYVALVEPLAHDPAVTNALATRLTDEVFTALDVPRRVTEALNAIPGLPPSALFLVGPLTSGAQNVVREQVANFLASPAFADLWVQVNRQVHDKLQALLNGRYEELPNLSVDGGEVQLNLVPIVAQIIQRIAQSGVNALGIDATVPTIPTDIDPPSAIQQLGSALGVSLPDNFGQVTIMSADQLSGYQDAVRTSKRLIAGVFVLSLLLIALTIFVANDRRRAVMWLGSGIVVSLFLGAVLLRRVRDNVIASVSTPGARAAARDVFAEVASSLRRAGLTVFLIALFAAVVAYLAGRPPWFTKLLQAAGTGRDEAPGATQVDTWVASHADGVRIAGIVLGLVVLFFTGIDWLPVAIVLLLVGLTFWVVSGAERRMGAPGAEGSTA